MTESNRKTRKKKDATVYDVAKRAGVSVSTVSRFLNRSSYVSESKSLRIEEALKSTGYKPNFQINLGENRRSMTIGVLVQNPESPHTNRMLINMESLLMDHGYSLVIASGHWKNQAELHALEYLARSQVDGVIIFTGSLTEKQILEFSEALPTVAVGYHVNGNKVRSLCINNELGGYMATLHLLQQGHVAIAHIKGHASQPDARARFSGYQKALKEAGIKPIKAMIKQGDFTSEVGYEKTIELLDSNVHFTALFAANDETAYGAMKALHDRNYRIPEDISIVGFDDLPTSRFFTPALTTLRQPIEELGAVSADALLKLLSGDEFDPRVPPIELIVRQSTKSPFR
ncbi:putative Transcriptional regulator [Vibrio nigripulchritudo SO65]|uniref:Transcriptional regulator n=1 Tax=Vibrio nigripulchritudo SOn1 TaxID=1238450 RepID=A0AAV2VYR1_9VIBR|nr:substrate-binding domain-containing protein [Vibrio nigripulchritudo]CCN33248.1 putative Transcriptional regulator [Vibrio nigripulchritudo AM115]CCN42290.1 putative Transcriptional regulator [Vibrio nigripulchritudo FTn2]CCN65915.1 putative Transcriptional regulator [Vibrio nigripulchritudo POn4]CCN75923.1 putative Transcriptional regulator [Vibrio nigripulchritudo SO65]CCO49539.1 putative Transcriptional regulator [Vibrio nigripulchritudo SOn1]